MLKSDNTQNGLMQENFERYGRLNLFYFYAFVEVDIFLGNFQIYCG